MKMSLQVPGEDRSDFRQRALSLTPKYKGKSHPIHKRCNNILLRQLQYIFLLRCRGKSLSGIASPFLLALKEQDFLACIKTSTRPIVTPKTSPYFSVLFRKRWQKNCTASYGKIKRYV